jgi:hypothetical protein
VKRSFVASCPLGAIGTRARFGVEALVSFGEWSKHAEFIRKHSPYHIAIDLFEGTDLSHFNTFLKSEGLDSDPDHVFQVANGMILGYRDGLGHHNAAIQLLLVSSVQVGRRF